MDVAIIEVSGIQATTTWARAIPSGIIGARILFQYTDPEWDNLVKNVIIRHGGATRTITDATNVVELPKELVAVPSAQPIWVGVYGVAPDGSAAIPTLWAQIGIVRNAADPSRDPSSDPSLPIWAQLLLRVEALESSGPANGSYTLPVGGENLGGVKNGGNVVINEDGTMDAPESAAATVELDTTLKVAGKAADAAAVGAALENVGNPTDEQITGAVSDWLDEHPEATTTVADGTVTKAKIADELLEELGLEPNHHLTEVRIPVFKTSYNAFYDGKESGTGLSTKPFLVPQYIKVVSKTSASGVSETLYIADVRFADSENWETAKYISARSEVIHGGFGREEDYLVCGVEDDKTVIVPTDEYGAKGREYIQLRWQNNNWQKGDALFELYAIYDDFRPKYNVPSPQGDGFFVEDIPVKWLYTSVSKAYNSQELFAVVPYYPDFMYYVRGGNYRTVVQYTLNVHALFDDAIFDGYFAGIKQGPSVGGCRGIFGNFKTTQFDESVSGGKDANYAWAYLKTPPESEFTGPKWLAFEMGFIAESASNNLGAEYYEQKIQEINNSGAKYTYISRWDDKDAPRRLLTTLVRKVEGVQDDGSRYSVFMADAESPLRNARWVLFGDSLTDNYGGHDLTGNYFATKIAREFGLKLDNRAKGGSNIYAGGSGNYTSVSGIVKLDEYLAEIEAGTTEQADYITVAFGTNAFRTDIGTNEDTSETYTASVYGATKYFIEKIREKVPNAVLGFVLSPRQNWGSADPGGARDVDGARTAIKTVCEEYGVPYIDMSTQSGITVEMLPDGIHISSAQSQKLYYHAMRRFMMGL